MTMTLGSPQTVSPYGVGSPIDTREWLMFVRQEATVQSEAYRLRLVGRLWWANVVLVVLPAVFGTAAAALAAASSGNPARGGMAFAAAALAGAAAVLTAIHKSLKCEDYQTECLRLSQEFQGIRVRAESLLSA